MRVLLFGYVVLRWLVLLLLLLLLLLFLLLNSPAPFLELAKAPLAKQGIHYDKLEGGILTGFKLTNLNYKNQVKAKSMALKVDFDRLKERTLHVNYMHLEEAQINKDFLTQMIESNSSQEKKSEGNSTLPFDKVEIEKLTLSLTNTTYEGYHINHAKITLNNVQTDMKNNHQGELKLLLDSNVSDVDLHAKMKDGKYEVVGDVKGERGFLNPMLKESNATLMRNPQFHLTANGTMHRLNYQLETKVLDLQYQSYDAQTKALTIAGYYDIDSSDTKNRLTTEIEANVANLTMRGDTFVNLNDINNSLVFDINTQLNPKEHLLQEATIKAMIEAPLKAQKVEIVTLPQLVLWTKGNLKNLNFNLTLKKLKVRQEKIEVILNSLNLKGESQPLVGGLKATLLSDFDSTLGHGKIESDAKLNYHDINNTLAFHLKTDFKSKQPMQTIVLAEQNLTIEALPSFWLVAQGDLKKLDFETNLNGLKVKQNAIALQLDHLALKGTTSPIQGETSINLNSAFDSTIAKGKILSDAKFNFNHLEESLTFDGKANLMAYDSYLNPLIKESNITLEGNTFVNVKAKGSLEALTLQANASTKLIKEKITSNLKLNTQAIKLNLKQQTVEGVLSINADAPNLALTMKSHFSGNYLKPKALKTDTQLNMSQFNAFGVNLTPFMPLATKLSSSSKGGFLKLSSDKLNLNVKSSDYEHIKFTIQSEKIFPSQLIELPEELNGKFVKLNLKGEATLSKQYFSLKGWIEANKQFKMNLVAKTDEQGLDVNLHAKHLHLTAKGDLNTKKLKAEVTIDSLTKVQKEFQSLYAFSSVAVDGAVKIKATLDGEKIGAKVSSKKLAFEQFAIEDLALKGDYDNTLLTINTLDFKTTGFENKKLNQHYYLNQQGVVNLGEKRDVYLDIHPNILVKATGTSNALNAKVKVKSLALGHPDYGDTLLSCDIDYQQTGEKKKITGSIFLDKLKLHYESKFLDPSQDNDVIVLSKKEKLNQNKKDSFLEDTAIDLSIYAGDANYKTRDIDLKFIVDVNANKSFGKPLGLLGKVKEINGRVEQAPKLFNVVDSTIVFKGEKEINPLLDIAVEYELPDILITINIHGNAKRPKLTFSSEPPLPKKDILSYLLLGVSTANLANGEGSLGREAQLFIMNQAARDLAYEVELDRVFIKDDGTGEGYAIQVGKKINDKTMFVIENSKEGNSFILEYEVNKNIKVEVGEHQKTVPSQSIDLYFRKRFR